MSEIILFSTGCPKCNVLIQKLNMSNIDYSIENDMTEIIDQGFTSVPILKVDDEYLSFKEANTWIKEHSEV